MSFERELTTEQSLSIPESLLPNPDEQFPTLDFEVLQDLEAQGWQRIGLMVAFVTSDGAVMMLGHHARDKNTEGALGPLGETSKQSGPIIEQPIETLYRGLQEELAVQEPAGLELWTYAHGGWVINQWPRGYQHPGQYACAISFPVFISDETKETLLSSLRATEEIGSLQFATPEVILEAEDETLRPGVKGWLTQMRDAGLLDPASYGPLTPLSFSTIYEASLSDIVLGQS